MKDAQPVHRVYVDAFWMDATDVINDEFARFTTATGYVTLAERAPPMEEFPGVSAEHWWRGPTVFTPTRRAGFARQRIPMVELSPRRKLEASGRPGEFYCSSRKYPVVHVAYEDAIANVKATNRAVERLIFDHTAPESPNTSITGLFVDY
jgi:formylglycine-generating enzyme